MADTRTFLEVAEAASEMQQGLWQTLQNPDSTDQQKLSAIDVLMTDTIAMLNDMRKEKAILESRIANGAFQMPEERIWTVPHAQEYLKLEIANDQLRSLNAQQGNEIDNLRAKVIDMDARIDSLKEELEDANTIIGNLQAEKEQLQAQLNESTTVRIYTNSASSSGEIAMPEELKQAEDELRKAWLIESRKPGFKPHEFWTGEEVQRLKDKANRYVATRRGVTEARRTGNLWDVIQAAVRGTGRTECMLAAALRRVKEVSESRSYIIVDSSHQFTYMMNKVSEFGPRILGDKMWNESSRVADSAGGTFRFNDRVLSIRIAHDSFDFQDMRMQGWSRDIEYFVDHHAIESRFDKALHAMFAYMPMRPEQFAKLLISCLDTRIA